MPDRRRHRGAHPKDQACFAPENLEMLRRATADFGWLRSRGYPDKAALQLVGDRYQLRLRQRKALQRCAVSETAICNRQEREVGREDLFDQVLLLDGYNVLLTVEAALGGGVILEAQDGAYRDLAAMSSHFQRVEQTQPALLLIGRYLADTKCGPATWYLDRPISNSGRLSAMMRDLAEQQGWRWNVELVPDPDKILRDAAEIVATADGGILDQGPRWFNLARRVVETSVPSAWLVDLSAVSEA